MDFKNIIRQIAKQNGVTPAEVKRDIKEAIDYFFNSLDGNTIYEGNSQFLSGIFYKQDEMYNYYDEYYRLSRGC